MSYPVLPAHPAGELRDRLARVRYVFTDLDGTMLTGSCALSDDEGNPSWELARVLVELKRAGIEVVPCTGRNRTMVQEDCRILGFNSYIGELGGLLMLDLRANEWEYFTGQMPYDPACGLTPHEVVERTGVVERILARWPGHIEYHNDNANGYRYREVTYGLRGSVPADEVQGLLDEAGLNLLWADNGCLTHISAPTMLTVGVGTAHAYNVVARGLDKGAGVERFCARRRIERAQTLAIGDSASDFLVAGHVGTFVCVENGLADPEVAALLERHANAYLARGAVAAGWIYMARALLEAHAAASV